MACKGTFANAPLSRAQEDYITPGLAGALVGIRRAFLQDMSKTFEKRKAIRPLLDFIKEIEE
jgi:hypothetical protein